MSKREAFEDAIAKLVFGFMSIAMALAMTPFMY